MTIQTATAEAHPNIAFIKYWGNRDEKKRLPVNGSISMNLGALATRTTVTFDSSLSADSLTINQDTIHGSAADRVFSILELVRSLAGISAHASVVSSANFPLGVGIASSAAAFAALAEAASSAAGLEQSEAERSRIARLGSGSACRSVPGGYVEWVIGTGDEDSTAHTIAPADHWHLVDLIALVSVSHKKVGSSAGHPSAKTSPYQAVRVADAPRRLDICREAILNRDFAALGRIAEEDSTLMHGVMMTQQPSLLYWEGASLSIMKCVPEWRADGLHAFFTFDAGPNAHVLTTPESAPEVERRLRAIEGVRDVLRSAPGGAARVVKRAAVI